MSSRQPKGKRELACAAFPKTYRLTKTDEFSSVFGFRKTFRSRHFLLHYRLRTVKEATIARLGIVVAKRLLRRSVDRNLVKRLARESFRVLRCRLRACDYVLRLSTKPVPLDRRVLAEEIRGLLGKMISPER